MNPLIEKFWNDAGYKVVCNPPIFSTVVPKSERRYVWYLKKDNISINVAGVSKIFEDVQQGIVECYIYYLNNQEYLEDDMLKIIKLKALI